jgi:hypothetical protein
MVGGSMILKLIISVVELRSPDSLATSRRLISFS